MKRRKKVSPKYIDLPYTEKRRILRKFHFENADAIEIVNEILYKALKKVKYKNELTWHIMNTLLVDGYMSFKKNGRNITQIDASTISLNRVQGNDYHWITDDGRIIDKDSIINLNLSSDLSHTSLVEMIYLKKINKNSKFTKKLIINKLSEVINKQIGNRYTM